MSGTESTLTEITTTTVQAAPVTACATTSIRSFAGYNNTVFESVTTTLPGKPLCKA